MSSLARHGGAAFSFAVPPGTPLPKGRLLPPSIPLSIGSVVQGGDGSHHRLVQLLGSGGEGSVYLTDTGLACKAYAASRLTTTARDKIEKMVNHPIDHPGICWPRASAHDGRGAFVGYLMRRAEGKELQKSVFLKPTLTRLFPAWTRRELVSLAETVLTSIHALHVRNVLLGDINPLNILVCDERSVFLVDTDSYQIEDYPCPVGTAVFLPPELMGADLSRVLRTPAHEAFAVATLVFMILIPGKPPYSHCGGEDPRANVLTRHFPYCLGDRPSQGVPSGLWRFIWSHFPRFLKEKFHAVFSGGERPSSAEWVDLMVRYRDLLDRGHATNELFPSQFKQLSQEVLARTGGEMRTCACCRSTFYVLPGRPLRDPICQSCLQSRVPSQCDRCGTEFDAPLPRAHKADVTGQSLWCDSCREASRVATAVSCKQCGTTFTLSQGEINYFTERGLSVPRRCRACREARRCAGVSSGAVVGSSSVRPTNADFDATLRQILGGRTSKV
jgi:hypothetical protein